MQNMRQMMTADEARRGMRVEVWQHPNLMAVPYQGERGQVLDVYPRTNTAAVRLDGYVGSWEAFIPLGHLTPER
jgi:hypothetical protein